MRKILTFISLFTILSCSNEKAIITDGEWLETFIIITGEGIDTIYKDVRIRFLKNGQILRNNYYPSGKYVIEKNKFHFSTIDALSTPFSIETKTGRFHFSTDAFSTISTIAIITSNEFILKGDFSEMEEPHKFKSIYHKTAPLEEKTYDPILYNLASICDFGEIKTRADGALLLNFRPSKFDPDNGNFVYLDPYIIEPKIKGAIDKALGILPQSETLNKFSQWTKRLLNVYEWETIDLKVIMENHFESSYFEDEDYLYVKLWITEK